MIKKCSAPAPASVAEHILKKYIYDGGLDWNNHREHNLRHIDKGQITTIEAASVSA